MKNILSFLGIFSSLFLLVFIAGNILTMAYTLPSDNIDSGGGRSTSDNYILESSVGQFGSGFSDSATYQINSGFEQISGGSFINIDVIYPTEGNIAMSNVSGFLSGDTGNGYSDIKVITDYDGYVLSIKSSTSPTMKCVTSSGCDATDSFSDYTPVGGVGNPDYAWSIGSSDSEFGFTPKGDDILTKYKYNSGNSTCGSGSYTPVDGEYCWDALSVSNTSIASSVSPNNPSGTTTNIKFRTQIGSNKIQPAGDYQAGITVTATAN